MFAVLVLLVVVVTVILGVAVVKVLGDNGLTNVIAMLIALIYYMEVAVGFSY